jgi:hypothetical protein
MERPGRLSVCRDTDSYRCGVYATMWLSFGVLSILFLSYLIFISPLRLFLFILPTFRKLWIGFYGTGKLLPISGQ